MSGVWRYCPELPRPGEAQKGGEQRAETGFTVAIPHPATRGRPAQRACGMTAPAHLHDGLFYGGDEELVIRAVPFLEGGLVAGETVLLACSEHTGGLLAGALGDDPRVGKIPRSVFRRPATAVAGYHSMACRALAAGAPRVRVLSELEFGRAPQDWTGWIRFDAAVNTALAALPVWNTCLYDVRSLPPEVLAAGECTHPVLLEDGSRVPNDHYIAAADFLRDSGAGRPEPIEHTQPCLVLHDLADLGTVRREVRRATLAWTVLPIDTITDFVYAVSEVATNAGQHGRPPHALRLWTTPGRVLCTVTDHGPGFDDPLAGYLPLPLSERPHEGRGLWLAGTFCDRLDFRSDGDGFTVCIRATV
jgi:anti-sigma regulatory factor (Ser/Thr protein kinase)